MPINSLNPSGPWVMPPIGVTGMPSGGRVHYVYQDSSGNGVASLTNIPSGISDSQNLTVAAALAKCYANRGDTIICLPNHVETIGANAWPVVAGVTVACYGAGDERATFNFNAAASQIAFSVANFRVTNAIFNLASTASTATTKAITITGASNVFDNCKFIAGAAGGAQQATIGIELATGADKTRFYGNVIFAPTDAAVPTLFKLTNAVDQCEWLGNFIDVGLSTTGGSVITFTTAPTNYRFGGRQGDYQGNYVRNSIASSTKAFVTVASATGYVDNNIFAIEAASGAAAAITISGNEHLGLNYGTVPGKYGILAGTVST